MDIDSINSRLSDPRMRLLVPLVAVLGLFLLGTALARPILMQIDERSFRVRIFRGTVADAFWQLGHFPEPADFVSRQMDESLGQIKTITLRRARSILLQIEGSSSWQKSASKLPANLLQSVGVKLLPGDRLWVDGLPYSPENGPLNYIPGRVRLERASSVRVETGHSTLSVRAANRAPVAVLSSAGHAVYEGDDIQVNSDGAAGANLQMLWKASQPLRIAVGGQEIAARSSAATVGQALNQVGISLIGLDFADPAENESVPDDGLIVITRVREEVMVELEPVPFETQYLPLSELELDSKRVVDTGSYGVRANQVRVRYENEEEVDRAVEGNWLAREPEPRVIGYGTNIIVRTTSTADGTIDYWRAVEMWATSYSPSRAGVPDDYEYFGITASGKRLEKGLVAIDRSLIPFGTQMYVPGYGFAEAADTGGGVKGLWIDLGYEDDNWVGWAQYVTVYFLTPIPPPGSITYILP